MTKIDPNRIHLLKQVLERPKGNPETELPIVNTTLQILGFLGCFECDEKTNKINYFLDKHDIIKM